MLLHYFRRILESVPPDLAHRIRTSMIRTQAYFHRLAFRNIEEPEGGWPVLLEIAALKSGTHLLDQILTGFSRVSPISPRALYLKSYNHQTAAPDDTSSILHALDTDRPLEW